MIKSEKTFLLAMNKRFVMCMTGKRPQVSLGCKKTKVEMTIPMLCAMRMFGPKLSFSQIHSFSEVQLQKGSNIEVSNRYPS